ncbi:MAG: hypothetical protein LBN95_03115 [Prevotellaceae bacterium]|nr:hypothetical protein [Prevotellaceae bacterium]
MRWAEITIGFQPKRLYKNAEYNFCLKGKFNSAQCAALGICKIINQ